MSDMNVSHLRAVRGLAALALVAVLGAVGCSTSASAKPAGPTFDASVFKLTSPAYVNGGDFPDRFTCKGGNVSPPLAWEGAPPQTAAFALVMEDYTWQFTHWVAYNIPGSPSGSLPENAAMTAGEVTQAVVYQAPCPAGSHSMYNVTLYALSARLSLTNATTKSEVEDAMDGKIIAQTELKGWN